jgi:hypothetical protein
VVQHELNEKRYHKRLTLCFFKAQQKIRGRLTQSKRGLISIGKHRYERCSYSLACMLGWYLIAPPSSIKYGAEVWDMNAPLSMGCDQIVRYGGGM